MPEIKKQYQIPGLDSDVVYKECIEALRQIGITEIKESVSTEHLKSIEGFSKSVWGWGGMTLKISVEKVGEGVNINAGGYIAQLATGPLTKKLDLFLEVFKGRLKTVHNYTFEYEKMNTFIPKFSYQITKTDMKVLIILVVGGFVLTIFGLIFGRGIEAFLSSAAIGLAYYWGRKYLYKNQEGNS